MNTHTDTSQEKKSQSVADNQSKEVIQQKENKTGLPDNLKSGIEAISGVDMSSVQVKRNSSEPAKVGALAYAQGNQIHLGPGQEKHLPHEAWHVVQQAQGRVKPTTSVNGKAVNDNPGLEKEADVMGAKAFQMRFQEQDKSDALSSIERGFEYHVGYVQQLRVAPKESNTVQLSKDFEFTTWSEKASFSTSHPTIQLLRSNDGLELVVQTGSSLQITQFELKDWWSMGTSILLLIEASAAFVGAGGAFGIGNLPAGFGLLSIGITKLIRAITAGLDAFEQGDKDTKKKITNIMRAIEGVASVVIFGFTVSNDAASDATKVTTGIFSIVKFLRSMVLLFDPQNPIVQYLLHAIQGIEGIVLIVGAAIDPPSALATGVGATAGSSKIIRSGLGIGKTKSNQSNAVSDSSTESSSSESSSTTSASSESSSSESYTV